MLYVGGKILIILAVTSRLEAKTNTVQPVHVTIDPTFITNLYRNFPSGNGIYTVLDCIRPCRIPLSAGIRYRPTTRWMRHFRCIQFCLRTYTQRESRILAALLVIAIKIEFPKQIRLQRVVPTLRVYHPSILVMWIAIKSEDLATLDWTMRMNRMNPAVANRWVISIPW